VWISAFDPGSNNRYFRTLASNLRGRTLQLFPDVVAALRDAEMQDGNQPSLFGFVGSEGLFAGVIDPASGGGFFPGGTKFIRQNAPETVSRAGAKIAEALHHLKLLRPCPAEGSHWLELGASPGGMTAELLARGYQVTAVDRAPLDARLHRASGLRMVTSDAGAYHPDRKTAFDAILSDMNGDAIEAMSHVIRLSKWLKPSGLVVFTLKLAGAASYAEVNDLDAMVLEAAQQAGLRLLRRSHLTYNRMEFTCIFELEG
jgi:23S rRNA C2498 (ribose-2'-O)-methylase RlmM